jgi:fibronectin type 3 domain-containing protein
LAATAGLINGTPTTTGTFTPTLQVADSANHNVNQPYSFKITAPTYSVLLSWTASPSSPVTGYNIYRSIASVSGYTKINPSPVTQLAYSDTAVPDGQIYYYAVTSVDASGDESTYSEDVQMNVP